MAQNDNAVLIAGTGAILYGVSGTATKPTLTQLHAYAASGALPSGLTSAGHTSLDDLPTPGQDGGDSTVLGSWQNKALITNITPPTDYVDIKSLQILDNTVLGWYHGGGDFSNPDNFIWPNTPSPQEQAFCFVYCHSATRVLGLWLDRGSVYRGDAMEFADDALSTVPLRITILQATGKPKATWIGDGLGTSA